VAVASAGPYASLHLAPPCASEITTLRRYTNLIIIIIIIQTDNHTSTPPLCFLTGRMPFLPPNQQSQSTEGTKYQSSTNKNNNFKSALQQVQHFKTVTLLLH